MSAATAPSVIGASRDQLHQIDPASIAPPLRAAVADRCLAAGRACFGRAKRATSNPDAEAATTEGRAWMRERRRWVPAPAAAKPKR
jgi:hypothetical protein